jgi:hypothetical protein
MEKEVREGTRQPNATEPFGQIRIRRTHERPQPRSEVRQVLEGERSSESNRSS